MSRCLFIWRVLYDKQSNSTVMLSLLYILSLDKWAVPLRQVVIVTHLPLVELLWRGGPQADQAVVLDDGARTFSGRGETFHLSHVVQALLHISKITCLRRGLFIRVGVILSIVLFTRHAALQTRALMGQLYLTLRRRRDQKKEIKKIWLADSRTTKR